MTSLTDIEKRALHALHYGKRLNPVRDWLILLLLAGVLLIASAALNIFIYVGVKQGPESAATVTNTPGGDAQAVSSVEAIFKKRAAEQGNYERVYQFVDPSK